MNRIVLKAQDLDGFLTDDDRAKLESMDALFAKALRSFAAFDRQGDGAARSREQSTLIALYDEMGHAMQDICSREDRIKVYPFVAPRAVHAEASRLIAKLRDVRTPREEFVYYTQRAFELLFNLAFGGTWSDRKNHLIVRTPVTYPVQNFAVHKIPDVDHGIENTVMCVMLRGALLPSVIMSKEIQEFSSHGYVTPFALFKIKRNDSRQERNMEYVLDLDRSYFDLAELEGKDLIFADPMNATGGSLITVVRHLLDSGVKPKSVKIFNAISALKGALRIVRALPEATVYTLWMDPVLNDLAYIMPGLGDAGDRINGADQDDAQRGILQLIADYGAGISNLYRSQIRMIEETVLRK